MNRLVLIFSFLSFPFFLLAQQTLIETIEHDNLEREYILYLPANYSANTPVPLLFNFHGYTSSAFVQMRYGDFRSIADTAGFIVVHPQGTLFSGNTHWNVGGWTVGSQTDDVGFTEALIDSLVATYNIDLDRIYATGMSNGGFMSFLLACELGDKIAAIASVTGSMTPQTFNACDPQHPTPVLQIHGTQDDVVPYGGNSWSRSIDATMQYWITYNNCNPTAIVTDIPNSNSTDGSTAEHFVYEGGDRGATTEHIKISGGRHTWPGAAFSQPGTNYDFNASFEIWKFFARYDINGLRVTTSTRPTVQNNEAIHVYPNPINSNLTIERKKSKPITYQLVSVLGEQLQSGMLYTSREQINLSQLPPNVYFLKVEGRMYKVLKIE